MFTRIHTVDKAIAPLLKAQVALDAVTTERSAMIDKNVAKIDELYADNKAADFERKRASRIAAALRAITDPEELTQALDGLGAPATTVEE